VMWEKVLVARSAASLQEALEELNAVKERLGEIYLSSPGQLQMALSLQNMIAVGEIIVRAASLRKESRGSHSRTDFPFLDPAFNGKFVFRLVDGQLRSRFVDGSHPTL
jgi:succinate dehydrogenase/fumarate reductase flavoprotein subunit